MDTLAVVDSFADLVARHYVFADKAQSYAAALRSSAPDLTAALPSTVSRETLRPVNSQVLELTGDKHLILRTPAPPGDPVAAPAPEASRDGEVGTLRFGAFFDGPEAFGPQLDQAMTALTDCRHLVIDLRDCGGGDTDSVPLLMGWLLGRGKRVLLGQVVHRDGPSEEIWSIPSRSRAFDDVPVEVWVSAGSFSGAEDIAYTLQASGRARVLGERTRGGAHPCDHFPLGSIVAQIPTGAYVSAFTGTNWEGVGVIPDAAA